jgi:uncharacterized LabA/DUF88 family protein
MRGLWLIDGSYVYKAMRKFQLANTQYNNKGVDYKKLKDRLKESYSIETLDSWYFNSTPDPATDAQNAYHRWLKTAEPQGPNIRVKLYGLKDKTYSCRDCDNNFTVKVQKGVDVGIATTALRLYERYDTVILSAGDGDFVDFIRFIVEDKDKKLYIAGFSGSISPDIQQFSTEVYLLNMNYAEICDTRDFRPFESFDEITVEEVDEN